ncbi:MAG: hypothetical protein QOI31_1763 [Solirubrobacterales bacterium]|jgi:hypothetical protein|nr:hypothetical protein [Solirubrobacterales bacterium]
MARSSSRRLRGRRDKDLNNRNPRKLTKSRHTDHSAEGSSIDDIRKRLDLVFWSWRSFVCCVVITALAVALIAALIRGEPVDFPVTPIFR